MPTEDLDVALQTIASLPDLADFSGPVAPDVVAKAEAALHVEFPASYRRFLLKLGAGSFGAAEFYGIARRGLDVQAVPNGIWYTLSQRGRGLPAQYVVVGADGTGSLLCLECSQDGREGPVRLFTPGAKRLREDPVIGIDFSAFFKAAIGEQLF